MKLNLKIWNEISFEGKLKCSRWVFTAGWILLIAGGLLHKDFLCLLGGLSLMVAMLLRLVGTRCPHCGRMLPRQQGTFCPYCGKQMFSNPPKGNDLKGPGF